MRTLLLLSSVIALTTSLSTKAAMEFNREKVFKATQSVVMVRGFNESGGLAYGSGVVIAENKVITNCHILRQTKKPWIARGENTFDVISVQAERYHDLCLLTTDTLPLEPITLGNGANIERNQQVLSIGHSNGAPAPLTSMGNVTSSYAFDSGNVIRSTAQFRMGASGSGLFDMEGKLIGINTFKTPGRRAYFYSLPIKWIDSVAKQPVETSFPIEGRTFWEAEDKDKPFFMQVALPKLEKDWVKLAYIAQDWVQKEPNSVEAWYELGQANEHLHKLDDAVSAYQEVIKREPNHMEVLFSLGTIAKLQGDTKQMHALNLTVANIDSTLGEQFSKMLGCEPSC